jgi:hypothetical protein
MLHKENDKPKGEMSVQCVGDRRATTYNNGQQINEQSFSLVLELELCSESFC